MIQILGGEYRTEQADFVNPPRVANYPARAEDPHEKSSGVASVSRLETPPMSADRNRIERSPA
jgi:hypothetical protein